MPACVFSHGKLIVQQLYIQMYRDHMGISKAHIASGITKLSYYISISIIAVQIGFEKDSYAVRESEGSVTVCVNSTTRTFNVPVTLETLDIGTAQGMYSYKYSFVCSCSCIHFLVPPSFPLLASNGKLGGSLRK